MRLRLPARYGVIGVGVQLAPLTASKIDVEAVRLPETPLTVMLYVPAAAVVDAVKVITLLLVAGFVPEGCCHAGGASRWRIGSRCY